MGTMAKAIESALPEHGFVEDGHPFFDAAIRREDCGTAGVSLDQQIIEIRRRLAGEFAECEVIDDKQIRADKAAQLAIEGVVGARARQSFEKKVRFDEQNAVIGAASGVTEGLGQKAFADADSSASSRIRHSAAAINVSRSDPSCGNSAIPMDSHRRSRSRDVR
jgi:hypothetical protein